MSTLRNLAQYLFHRFSVCRAERHGDLYLPALRSNEGLKDSDAYVASAVEQVEMLRRYSQLGPESHVLDFGSGQGRFANGVLSLGLSLGAYTGVDTNPNAVRWCKRWIEKQHPTFNFVHLPAYNARYNPFASDRSPLPFPDNHFTEAFLNSVFSHMLSDDIRFYLGELARVLRPGGLVYMTAFVEENVPAEEENPANYISESTGALHRVRFERGFFDSLIREAGLDVELFLHQEIPRTKQSVILARKPAP